MYKGFPRELTQKVGGSRNIKRADAFVASALFIILLI
jgi:hypothetical protein